MNKVLVIIGSILAPIILIGLMLAGSYNGLVGKYAEVEQAQAKIDATLQRRYDLIPNVVNSVKGYMTHEKEIFTQIADARAKIGSNASANEKQEAQTQLDSAISRLLVVQENYPQLKANEQVQSLITELEGTENRIFVARNDYNKVTTDYNKKIRSFPTNIIAGMFNFEKVNLIEASKEAQTTVPKVQF